MWQREVETRVDSAWLWTGQSVKCLEKVQRDLDRKVMVTGAGKGSPGPGRGAGHSKVSRVTVNKNQQCMLEYTAGVQLLCVVAGEDVCTGSSHGEQRRGDWEGESMPEMSDFHWSLWGRWAKTLFSSLSCIKTDILFTQNLSYPRSQTLVVAAQLCFMSALSPWEAGCTFDFLSFYTSRQNSL